MSEARKEVAAAMEVVAAVAVSRRVREESIRPSMVEWTEVVSAREMSLPERPLT